MNREKKSLYILGGSPSECEKCHRIILASFPDIRFLGKSDGYRSEDELVIEEILSFLEISDVQLQLPIAR